MTVKSLPRLRASPVKGLIFVLLALLSAARFVHLDADFPSGVTTSRALYTDEGLYSFNAVRASSGRPWYVPGELNTSINLPVGPMLQAGVFRVAGRSVIAARGLVAVSAVVLIAAAFALTLRYASFSGAALVAATLSCDFLLFSYSRLAILDVVMTTILTLAFVLASAVRANHRALMATLTGVLVGLAALTKTTAVCAVPAAAYLCGASVADSTYRRRVVGIMLAACALVIAGYNAMAWSAYPGDYVYFHRIAEVRLASGPLDFARNFVVAIFNAIRFDPWVSLAAVAWAALFKGSPAFRHNRLARTSAIWVLGFFVMLSITSYQPSRYFVVLLVPSAMLCGVAIGHIGDLPPARRSAATVSVAVVACLLIYNVWHISMYLRHPAYSFAHMAREVGAIVNVPAGSHDTGMLLGNMAASIALQSGVNAISLEYGSKDLETRIRAACPTHFIALETPGSEENRVLSSYYALEPVKEWRVFDNYFEHRPVRLFRLHPRADQLPACPVVAP